MLKKEKIKDKKIIVVGGGASGLMAAICAGKAGASVTVLEQNSRPGRKLLVTGNGKCNLTNTEVHEDDYRGEHPEFAGDVIKRYSVQETISFFLSLGIYTVNHGGYVYPYSEVSSSVLESLLASCEREKVKVKCSEKVIAVEQKEGCFFVRTEGWTYPCDAVILSCGSSASSVEGSDGSGYDIARELGHTLIPLRPALTYLTSKDAAVTKWGGVRVTAGITLLSDGVSLITRRGQLQLTDRGVSGIPAFQVSRYASSKLQNGRKTQLLINFMPDYDRDSFGSFMHMMMALTGKPAFECLKGLFAPRLIRIFEPWADEEDQLIENITGYTIEINGTGSLDYSQVAAGGINTDEVDSSTMESKLVPGLYFTGEMLDIDGDCGGYNLQWAWSSGMAAGISAARSEEEESITGHKI